MLSFTTHTHTERETHTGLAREKDVGADGRGASWRGTGQTAKGGGRERARFRSAVVHCPPLVVVVVVASHGPSHGPSLGPFLAALQRHCARPPRRGAPPNSAGRGRCDEGKGQREGGRAEGKTALGFGGASREKTAVALAAPWAEAGPRGRAPEAAARFPAGRGRGGFWTRGLAGEEEDGRQGRYREPWSALRSRATRWGNAGAGYKRRDFAGAALLSPTGRAGGMPRLIGLGGSAASARAAYLVPGGRGGRQPGLGVAGTAQSGCGIAFATGR